MSELTKIVPRGKWVLVLPLKDESKENEHGLILPATEEKEQKARGKVISIGTEVTDIKEDDEVIYGAFAGETLKRQEEGKEVEYKLLLDEDVIAFLK